MRQIWRGARVFDGVQIHDTAELICEGDQVVALNRQPTSAEGDVIDLAGGILAPGFIDMQVNGGGGRLLGQGAPDVELNKIASAHGAMGSTHVLPTLITSDPDTMLSVIEATKRAIADGVAGIAGLHLEGPFLDPVRKGAHDAALMRAMQDQDLAVLIEAVRDLPVLMVTLAPEQVSLDQIAALAASGAVVMLGHSNCSDETARAALDAGAMGVTHLYNAMSPLTHRAPGLVGAALDSDLWAGIIPDGVHVSAPAFRIACRAKPGRMVAVSDAMAVAGSDLQGFTLNDRRIMRAEGRLTLEDGTLAGADVSLPQALRWMVHEAELDLSEALAMMTSAPATLLGLETQGRFAPGARADLVHLSDALELQTVWRDGKSLS